MNRSMVSWFGGPTKYSDVMRWHLVSMLKGKERRDNIHITTVYSHYLVCLSSFPRKIICACLGKKWKKNAQRYRRFVGVFSRKIRNTARLAFHLWYDMIWYDMIWYDCIPHVSVQVCSVSGWKMHKRWQYPARNLSSGCNYSDEKLVAIFPIVLSHFKLWPPIIQIIQGPKGPKVGMPQKSQTSPGGITFKPWLSSCRSNSSRSKPRGLPPFCGSWIREIVHFPLWD